MHPVQQPSKAPRLNAEVNVIPTTFPAHQGFVLDKQKAVYRVQVITAGGLTARDGQTERRVGFAIESWREVGWLRFHGRVDPPDYCNIRYFPAGQGFININNRLGLYSERCAAALTSRLLLVYEITTELLECLGFSAGT